MGKKIDGRDRIDERSGCEPTMVLKQETLFFGQRETQMLETSKDLKDILNFSFGFFLWYLMDLKNYLNDFHTLYHIFYLSLN